MSDALYAHIEDAQEIRRDILNCSKGLLSELQDLEQYRLLREEKRVLMQEFAKHSTDLNRLIGRLRARLPKPSLKQFPVVSSKEVQKQQSRALQKVAAPRKSKLELLEQELSKIEERLQSLE